MSEQTLRAKYDDFAELIEGEELYRAASMRRRSKLMRADHTGVVPEAP